MFICSAVAVTDDDICSWCNRIRRMWRYLAKQCTDIIMAEVHTFEMIKGPFGRMAHKGNGIFYMSSRPEGNTVENTHL